MTIMENNQHLGIFITLKLLNQPPLYAYWL